MGPERWLETQYHSSEHWAERVCVGAEGRIGKPKPQDYIVQIENLNEKLTDEDQDDMYNKLVAGLKRDCAGMTFYDKNDKEVDVEYVAKCFLSPKDDALYFANDDNASCVESVRGSVLYTSKPSLRRHRSFRRE